jgi:hypothetical protein
VPAISGGVCARPTVSVLLLTSPVSVLLLPTGVAV